jgi:hypothetical protein
MNFSYLYLDEKSLSYHNLLQKVLMNGNGNGNGNDNGNNNDNELISNQNQNYNRSNYENFMGYDSTSKKTYFDVIK